MTDSSSSEPTQLQAATCENKFIHFKPQQGATYELVVAARLNRQGTNYLIEVFEGEYSLFEEEPESAIKPELSTVSEAIVETSLLLP